MRVLTLVHLCILSSPPLRWLYTQYLEMDANFKLKLKERGFKDVELAPGWAYFVEEAEYLRVISEHTEDVEVGTGLCSTTREISL